MSDTGQQVRYLLEGVIFAALIIGVLDLALGFTVLRDASESVCSIVGMATTIVGLPAGFGFAVRRLVRRLDADGRT